jgi:uncharacterized membrane protein YccC
MKNAAIPFWPTFDGLCKQAAGMLRYTLTPGPEQFKYAIQVGCSVVLSTLAAFYFDISDPYWAPTAAIVVANRVHGQVLSKSFFRLIGTLCGIVMGIFLVGAFSQASDLFVVCFALWMAICTYASTLLRNFRTYSAALAGYTAAIIVFGSMSAPDHVLELALARGAAVVCGISATAVTSVIFSGQSAGDGLSGTIERSFDALCALVCDAARGVVGPEFEVRCHRLARNISAIPSVIEFASAESSRVRTNQESLRQVVAELMHSLTAIWSFSRNSNVQEGDRLPPDEHLQSLREEAAAVAKRIGEFRVGASEELVEVGRQLGFFGVNYRRYVERLAAQADVHTFGKLVAMKNLAKSLDQLSIALEGWNAYCAGTSLAGRGQIVYDIDYRSAAINALRTLCAVLAGGFLWIECAWPSGTSVLEMLAIACSLYASTIHPRSSAVSYLIGASIGCVIAFCCYVWILPALDGFPLLAVLVCVVIGSVVLHMDPARPKFTSRATSCATFFLIAMHLGNPMSYDVSGFINRCAGMLCGIVLAVLAYTLIFPVSPQYEIRKSLDRLLREIKQLVSEKELEIRSVWESRMYDRLARVMSYIEIQRDATKLLVEDFFAMIRIGVELISLKNLSHAEHTEPELRAAIDDAVACVGGIGTNNEATANHLTGAADSLFSRNIEDKERHMRNYLAVASLKEIAYLIRKHRHILIERTTPYD